MGLQRISELVADAPVHLIDGVVKGGMDLFVFRNGDPVSEYLSRGLVWHTQIVKILAHLMAPGRVFVDVGAHIGLFSVLAAKVAGPTGKVISFEPDPVNRAVLTMNARRNRVDLDIRGCAISSEAGRTTLFTSADNRAIHSIVPEPRLEPSGSVATSTLERELAGLGRVDVIKLDVQGAEPDIIAGIGDMLFRLPRAPYVIMEVNPAGWVQRDPNMEAFHAFVQRYQYDMHVLVAGEGTRLVPPALTWGTFVAVCNDFIRYGSGFDDLDIVLWPPPRHAPPASPSEAPVR